MKFTRDQFVWYVGVDVRLPAIIVHVPGERHTDGWVHHSDAYSIVVLCQPDGGAGRWGTRAHVDQLSAFTPESEAKGGGAA